MCRDEPELSTANTYVNGSPATQVRDRAADRRPQARAVQEFLHLSVGQSEVLGVAVRSGENRPAHRDANAGAKRAWRLGIEIGQNRNHSVRMSERLKIAKEQ